jgi:hypothetical protein
MKVKQVLVVYVAWAKSKGLNTIHLYKDNVWGIRYAQLHGLKVIEVAKSA